MLKRAPLHSRKTRFSKPLLIIGVLCIVVSILTFGWVGYFYWHYKSAGSHLVNSYSKALKSTSSRTGTRSYRMCSSASASPVQVDSVAGILMIPSQSVTAPVQNGTSSSILSDAVGHDPTSSWPSPHGTSVFLAHDVSWFSGLPKLSDGAIINFSDSCWTYRYSVTGHSIVKASTNLYTTSWPSLYLVTCWPTNALYWTPYRYVIRTKLISIERTRVFATGSLPSVSTTKIVAKGATSADSLASNPTPLGYLKITGTPSSVFRNSTLSLTYVRLALSEFFLQEKSANLAPVEKVIRGANVSIDVSGVKLLSATVSDIVQTSKGEFYLKVYEQVSGSVLNSSPMRMIRVAS